MYAVVQLLEQRVLRFASPVITGSDNGPGLRANLTIPCYTEDIMLIELTLVLLLPSMLIRIRYKELNTLIKWIKFKIRDACMSGHPLDRTVLLPRMGHRPHPPRNKCMLGIAHYGIRTYGKTRLARTCCSCPRLCRQGHQPPSLPIEVSYSSSLTQQGSGFVCLTGDFGGRTHTVNVSNKGGTDGRYPAFIPQAELW